MRGEATVGKRVGKDSGRGKLTFPGLDHSLLVDEALSRVAIDAEHSPIGRFAREILWVAPRLGVASDSSEEVVLRGGPFERFDPYFANTCLRGA